jgi:hypothetical protein
VTSAVTRLAPPRLLAPLAALALAAAGAGCSLFPKHEEVWTPIPTRLGERRIAGTDTAWVLAEPAYEIHTRDRERLPDLKSDLDLAARTYRRFFGADPRPVALLLADSAAELAHLDTMAAHLRGLPIVPLVTQARRGRDRYTGPAPAAAPRVARAWIRARAGAGARIPRWLDAGAVALVAQPALEERGIELLRRNKKLIRPLPALFAQSGPDEALDPFAAGRPDSALRRLSRAQRDSIMVFHVQAAAVAQFLVDRAGAPVIGRLVDATRTATDPAALLAAAGVDPSSPEALDKPWRDWLQQKDRALGLLPETYRR